MRAPEAPHDDVSALTSPWGRPITGVGVELEAVEPLPSSPNSPLPHAYNVPSETNNEWVRAPAPKVTLGRGIFSGRDTTVPLGRHRSLVTLSPHPQASPRESMARPPSKGMGLGNEVIVTPWGNSTFTADGR